MVTGAFAGPLNGAPSVETWIRTTGGGFRLITILACERSDLTNSRLAVNF
jgi:hypothetical protein